MMRFVLAAACFLQSVVLVTGADSTPQATAESKEPIFICPLPRCGRCPSKERASAPAVGFALDIGYGTAAIKYDDGTLSTIGPVEGSSEYVALMKHLAKSPIERMSNGERPPPGVNESDSTTWPNHVLHHAKRYLNKVILRPATPETRIIAEMVSKLILKVTEELGAPVKTAVVASPDRNKLTEYEIKDVFDYLWVEDLMRDKHDPVFSTIYSMSASMAGYNQGLCTNYTDAYYCAREEHHTPTRRILQLDFSDDGLRLSMDRSNTARRSFTPEKTEVDLTLSDDNLDKDSSWNLIQARIREFVGSTTPETLLLTGERASDPHFVQAVKDALGSSVLPLPVMSKERRDSKETIAQDKEFFLFATALGAAEMAKRRQEGMARCRLPEECRGGRYEEPKLEYSEDL